MTRSDKIAIAGVLLEHRRKRRQRPPGPWHGLRIAAAGAVGAGIIETASLLMHALGMH